MQDTRLDEVVGLLEKTIAALDPEEMSESAALELLKDAVRVQRLIDHNMAALSRRIDDASR